MLPQRLAPLALALLLSACTAGEAPPTPSHDGGSSTPSGASGYRIPTPGVNVDRADIIDAMTALREAAGSEDLYELTIFARQGLSARLIYPGPDGPRALRWSPSGAEPDTNFSEPDATRPIAWSDVDVAGILDALEEDHSRFYECATTIRSAQYQGTVETLCDQEFTTALTTRGEPITVDLSTADGLRTALDTVLAGAPEEILGLELFGTVDGSAAVTFPGDGEPLTVTLREGRGVTLRSGINRSTSVPAASLDADVLFACAQKMQEESGLTGWHAWLAIGDDGPTLYWDINDSWDPDDQLSVTDLQCQPKEPS